MPASRRRHRNIALAAAAGALAVGAAAIVVPSAFAGDDLLGLGGTVEHLPVDEAALGLITVGDVVEAATSLTYADDTDVIEFSRPDASYVKLHFERLLLTGDDYVTVSSPDGAESYRYDDAAVGEWATSISGDTAIVELHKSAEDVASSALGAVFDKVAYGFPQDVVADLVDEKNERARPEESLCSADDKKPSVCYESSYPEIVDHADPVARLLIDGTILCTAFRVGEDNRMLTNHHCFSETWEARRTEVWFGYECTTCEGGEETNPIKVDGRRVLATSEDLDYTLFSVEDFDAIEQFGYLTLSTDEIRRGEAIYIPQHPAGRATEIAIESTVDGGNCVVNRPVYDGYIANSDVAYYCDTEFGSSGSPVLSRDTHEVIALHHFGGCPNSGVNASLIKREIGDLI
ncbi:trypsin-like serine peptidase [Glycomyces arizonensis]|uniref:trypsin-like serine peptidase n=1 Tax=Glycomyces arizonensis TaxID=256035 RepID=UPI000400CB13|nr:serine protease [Glycomyces arizonensis]